MVWQKHRGILGDLSKLDDAIAVRFIEALDQTFVKGQRTAATTTYHYMDSDKLADSGFIEAHKVGECVQYSNFVSASEVLGLYDRDIILTIHGKNGVNVAPVSQYPVEKEILYSRDTFSKRLTLKKRAIN